MEISQLFTCLVVNTGDPERDYNFFSIAAEYYSQGNGNFRDVSQNRRNDVFFNKDVGDFNVKTFFSLNSGRRIQST